jgi:hypothetical protein
MATPTQPDQTSSGPDPQKIKEIENVLVTLRNVKREAIEKSDEQREDLKSTLKKLLLKGPLTPNAAMSKYIVWELEHATPESKRPDAKELEKVLDEIKDDLKKEQADAFKKAVQHERDKLDKEQEELTTRKDEIEKIAKS